MKVFVNDFSLFIEVGGWHEVLKF